MKKKIYFHTALILMAVMLVACMDLDDFLFNEDGDINAYYFDDYTGDVITELPEGEFEIDPDFLHEVSFVSGSSPGYTLQAVYLGDINTISEDTVIVYCHGNRDHMDYYWPRAKLLAHVGGKHRYGVLMFDYRGYGLSEGEPTEDGLYKDVEAALQWLKEHGLESDRLIMYGFSLGSAPATHSAAYPGALKPEKLILESPFSSSAAMVQDATTLTMPSEFFTTHDIDNARKIRLVEQPLLWIHGTDDKFLKIDSHGEAIYTNYNGDRSDAHRVNGAGHADVPEVMGFGGYLGVVEGVVRW